MDPQADHAGADVYNDAKATGKGIDEVGVLLGDKE